MKRYFTVISRFCLVPAVFALFGAFTGHAQEATEPESPWDSKAAVVLSYRSLGESRFSALPWARFREQMDMLAEDGHTVVALGDILNAQKNGAPLPALPVALTLDSQDRETLDAAVPFLTARRWPFTLFFDPNLIDRGTPGTASWEELRALARLSNATLGLRLSSFSPLPSGPSRADILSRVNSARTRYREELGGAVPRFLSWPADLGQQKLREILLEHGFEAAFGPQSGIVSPAADRFALPRFDAAESFSDPERFRTVIRALPMPVIDLAPDGGVLSENPPNVGFSLAPGLNADIKRLSCFASGIGRIVPQVLGKRRVELRFSSPLEPGPTHLHCTLPSHSEDQDGKIRQRWLGLVFVVPPAAAAAGHADKDPGESGLTGE